MGLTYTDKCTLNEGTIKGIKFLGNKLSLYLHQNHGLALSAQLNFITKCHIYK